VIVRTSVLTIVRSACVQLAEPCSEQMAEQLGSLMPMVMAQVNETSPLVCRLRCVLTGVGMCCIVFVRVCGHVCWCDDVFA
jgi:hypothetical protein